MYDYRYIFNLMNLIGKTASHLHLSAIEFKAYTAYIKVRILLKVRYPHLFNFFVLQSLRPIMSCLLPPVEGIGLMPS